MKKFSYRELYIISCINKVAKREYWMSCRYGRVTFWQVSESGCYMCVNCVCSCTIKYFKRLFIDSGFGGCYDYGLWRDGHDLYMYLSYIRRNHGKIIVFDNDFRQLI